MLTLISSLEWGCVWCPWPLTLAAWQSNNALFEISSWTISCFLHIKFDSTVNYFRRWDYHSLWTISGDGIIILFELFQAMGLSFSLNYFRWWDYHALWTISGDGIIVLFKLFQAMGLSFSVNYFRRWDYHSLCQNQSQSLHHYETFTMNWRETLKYLRLYDQIMDAWWNGQKKEYYCWTLH